MITIIICYTCFVISTALIPLTRTIWGGLYSLIVFNLQPFLYIISITCLMFNKKLSFQGFIERQQQFLVCYAFSFVNVFILWKMFYTENGEQNSFQSFISYINIFLSLILYSLIIEKGTKTAKYVMIQSCTIVRIFTYALKTTNIIEKASEIEDVKDYYLIFFATQIAICGFFMDETRKSKNKQTLNGSLLTNEAD